MSPQAADAALGGLAQWGIGGAILAVLVAPVFLMMVRGAQKREDDRGKRDEEDIRARREREGKLVDALVASVEQQKMALEQWRAFEVKEERVHEAMMVTLSQVTAHLGSIADRLKTHGDMAQANLETHGRVAGVLNEIASRLKAPA